MKKEENFLEDFKKALVSTIKSISQKKDCDVKFGSSDNSVNNIDWSIGGREYSVL